MCQVATFSIGALGLLTCFYEGVFCMAKPQRIPYPSLRFKAKSRKNTGGFVAFKYNW